MSLAEPQQQMGCGNRTRHVDYLSATLEQKKIREKTGNRRIGVYRCKVCNYWHVSMMRRGGKNRHKEGEK